MTMLAQYQAARTALAEATRVDQVLSLRDETAHVKLYARQIRDRTLLADATEFQMRCERRLGVLLEALEEAGQLARRGGQRKGAAEGEPPPARLKDIGVDLKLSAHARRAASISSERFEHLVEQARAACVRTIVIQNARPGAKHRRQAKTSSTCAYDFTLASGRSLGSIHLGELAALRQAALLDVELLGRLIDHQIVSDGFVTVKGAIRESLLTKMIAEAQDAIEPGATA